MIGVIKFKAAAKSIRPALIKKPDIDTIVLGSFSNIPVFSICSKTSLKFHNVFPIAPKYSLTPLLIFEIASIKPRLFDTALSTTSIFFSNVF